jgi:cytochrome c2
MRQNHHSQFLGGMSMQTRIAAAASLTASMAIALAQDLEKGAKVFKQCQSCHSIGTSAQNKNHS